LSPLKSLCPKILKSILRYPGISNLVLDILWAEMSLQRSGIVSMRMRLEGELGDDPIALGHGGIRTASALTSFQRNYPEREREIANALNARGIATARGRQWHAKSVGNILERTGLKF